jgi:hypothetical protein
VIRARSTARYLFNDAVLATAPNRMFNEQSEGLERSRELTPSERDIQFHAHIKSFRLKKKTFFQ